MLATRPLALLLLVLPATGCGEAPSCDGRLRGTCTFEGVRGPVVVAPDGSRLAVARDGGGVTLVDVRLRWVRSLGADALSVALGTAEEPAWWGAADGHVFAQDDDQRNELVARPTEAPVDGLAQEGGRLAWSSSGAGTGGVLDLESGRELLRLDGLAPLFHPGWDGPRVLLLGDGAWALARRRGEPLVLRPLAKGLEPVVLRGYPATSDPRAAATATALLVAEPPPAGSRDQGFALRRLALDTGAWEELGVGLRGGALVNLWVAPDGSTVVEGDPLEPGVRVHGTRPRPVVDDAEGGGSSGLPPLVLDDPVRGVSAWLPLGFHRDAQGHPRLIASGPGGHGTWSWGLRGDLDVRPWVGGPFESVDAAGGLGGPWTWSLLRRADGRRDLRVTSVAPPGGDVPAGR